MFDGNLWIEARERDAKDDFLRGTLARHMADNLGNGLSNYFPVWLCGDSLRSGDNCGRRANVSGKAQRYLDRLGLDVEDLFFHVLATLHDPAYREDNAGALRMEWPRIPLPNWPDGGTNGVEEAISSSAACGHELAALLDADTPVLGVTKPPIEPTIAAIAVPAATTGRHLAGEDFAVTAGWGRHGLGDAVMPGKGRAVERAYTADESAAKGDTPHALGDTAFDFFSTARRFGKTSLPLSRPTTLAANQSSRNGSRTANGAFSDARSGLRKFGISPTRPEGLSES